MNIATVKIVDPTNVKNKAQSLGDNNPDNGAIFVECKELGFTGENLLYCRYGLSIPYIQLNIGDKVLIESTICNTERWFYVGLVDCAGTITPTTNMKLKIIVGNYEIEIDNATFKIDMNGTTLEMDASNTTITANVNLGSSSASESFILGDVFDTWLATFVNTTFNTHTHICAALGSASAPPVPLGIPPTGHLSTKIKGE